MTPSPAGRLAAAVSAFLLLATVSVLFFLHAGESRHASAPAKHRRVLLIGIDGCRSDALRIADTPRLKALAAAGTVTWDAVAGGEQNGPTQQPTVSGPGWSSILCGVSMDKHRVFDNKFIGNQLAIYPHFFRRLKEARPSLVTGQATTWAPLERIILGQTAADFVDWHFLAENGSTKENDSLAVKEATEWLGKASPDVLFVHFDGVDAAGHATGFSPENPVYLSAIHDIDGYTGRLLDAVRARPEYDREEWLTLVVTDHGGNGTSHGGQTSGERRIFLIAHGGEWSQGRVSLDTPRHTVVPSIIANFLGIDIPPAWGWEPGWRPK